MLSRINDYLLLNHPKLWKSNIHWSLIITFCISIIFLLFADNFDTELTEDKYEHNDELYFGWIPLFLWSGAILFWLYTQYKNQLPLRRFTFFEVLSSNFLNLFSTIITVLPVLILIALGIDERGERYNSFENFLVIMELFIALGLIPIVFSSLIIRFFSLIEILLVILFGFLYCLSTGFVLGESISSSEASIAIFFSLNYLILFSYVITRFRSRQYNQLDKRLALALVFYTPWFIGMNQIIFFGHMEYDSSIEVMLFEFCIHLGVSLSILSILSWVITKSIQEPITIK